MAVDTPPAPDPAAGPIGAHSLEGALADHLASCAVALLEKDLISAAVLARAEARRIQRGLLRRTIIATSADRGMALPGPPTMSSPCRKPLS